MYFPTVIFLENGAITMFQNGTDQKAPASGRKELRPRGDRQTERRVLQPPDANTGTGKVSCLCICRKFTFIFNVCCINLCLLDLHSYTSVFVDSRRPL